MGKEITFDIPYIRLCFQAELLADSCLPASKTPALRGGMGEMLLRQNCVSDKDCGKCRFSKACIVSHTFYTPMEKRPHYMTGPESVGYLIECTDTRTEFSKGSCFEFSLLLFGDSIVFFNIYLQAFCQLGMVGLGKDKACFRISRVSNTQGKPIVYGNEVNMSHYRIGTIGNYIKYREQKLRNEEGVWTLTFITPLAMKHQQKYMNCFDAEAVVKGAARRMQMLNYYTEIEADLPDFSEYPQIRTQTVRRQNVRRYSATQDSHMTLRGITGKIVFERMPQECVEYLIAGELTHIGKNTSFGFGKYVLHRE